MHPKSIFCNHDFEFSKLILPNGQERMKEHCANCGKTKNYCVHDYETIAKTYFQPKNIDNFNGSAAAFKEVADKFVAYTEILFKCKNCGDLHKETLKGKEINY
jgi:hypothetical protein